MHLHLHELMGVSFCGLPLWWPFHHVRAVHTTVYLSYGMVI
jgi:hypothetical protein